MLDDLDRTHHGARVLSYDSGEAARLERTSALARVSRLAGDGDDREALMDASFGVKTYPATSVGWVPVGERDVERFTLGARPPMDPVKSENRLMKVLGRTEAPKAQSAPEPEQAEQKRGLFGRRR
jgi:hypothetical protein